MKRPLAVILLGIALAVVCLAIGAVLIFSVNNGFWTNNPFDQRNIASELEESKTLKVDAGKPITLTVADDAGDITVTGADVDSVQVKVVKTAYDSTQARADEEVKGIQYTIEQNGNNITLQYELPKSMNFNNNVNTVHFIITVPHETTVSLDTGLGIVIVDGTKGNVDIKNSFGNVTLSNIEGKVQLDSQSGQVTASSVNAGEEDIELTSDFGTLTLEKASGTNITVSSNSGAVTAEDVKATGHIELTSDFGNVNFERGSADSLTMGTKSGAVTLTSVNIAGALEIKNDFGDLNLASVKAESYDAQTNSGAITIDGAQGMVRAHTDFGNVTVREAENATLDLSTQSGSIDFEGSLGEGPHTVHSDFGSIEMSIPADSALDVDLSTDFGQVESDIPVTVTLSGDLKEGQQAGTMNGGGSSLTVSTKSGGISLKILDN